MKRETERASAKSILSETGTLLMQWGGCVQRQPHYCVGGVCCPSACVCLRVSRVTQRPRSFTNWAMWRWAGPFKRHVLEFSTKADCVKKGECWYIIHKQGHTRTLSHTRYMTEGHVHESGSREFAEPQRSALIHKCWQADQYNVSCT